MKNRIVCFSAEDIDSDHIGVAHTLTERCKKSGFIVRGTAVFGEHIQFFLEKCDSTNLLHYIIDSVKVESITDFDEIVNQRCLGGYTTIGFFNFDSGWYGLFEKMIRTDK